MCKHQSCRAQACLAPQPQGQAWADGSCFPQSLFSGAKSRHEEKTLWPFPGPLQQLQKANLGTCFLSKCLKLPSLAASAPLNYLIIVLLLLENHRIFLMGLKGHTIQSLHPGFPPSTYSTFDRSSPSIFNIHPGIRSSLPPKVAHSSRSNFREAVLWEECGLWRLAALSPKLGLDSY